MKIEFDDHVYQLDPMDIDMPQSLVIADYTGLTVKGWLEATTDPDHPKWLASIACLYWLMMEQNGQELSLTDKPNFAPMRFYLAWAAANAAPAGPAAEPDPTNSGGSSDAETPPPSPVSPAGS